MLAARLFWPSLRRADPVVTRGHVGGRARVVEIRRGSRDDKIGDVGEAISRETAAGVRTGRDLDDVVGSAGVPRDQQVSGVRDHDGLDLKGQSRSDIIQIQLRAGKTSAWSIAP